MERMNYAPEGVEKGQSFRTKGEYLHAVLKFSSMMKKEVEKSGLDSQSSQKARLLLDSFYDLSPLGLFYSIGPLSLMEPEPGFLYTTPQEKIGISLLVPALKEIDDIIDSSSFPRFASPLDLKNFLWRQRINLKRNTNATIEEITGFILSMYNKEKQDLLIGYFDDAIEAHWEYADKGKPGTYGYNEALQYRMRTTVKGIKVGRELMNFSPNAEPNGKPGITAQLIDDAVDMVDDSHNNMINLWVGMAKDTGELDVLVNSHLARERTLSLIRGRNLRRHMPTTLQKYRKTIVSEMETITNPAAIYFHRTLAKFV